MPSLPWYKMEAMRWLSDGKLRKCDAEGIAVLIQAINVMHVEDTYYLTGTVAELSRVLNLRLDQTEEGIRQLEEHDALDVHRGDDCAPFCDMSREVTGLVTLVSRRRMREYDAREKARLRKKNERLRKRKKHEKEGGHAVVAPPVTNTHAGARAPSLSYSSSEVVNASKGRVGSPREDDRPAWAPSEEAAVEWFVSNAGLSYGGKKRTAETEARKFWAHYDARQWVDKYERPLRNWRSLAKSWMLREGEFDTGGAGRKAEATGDPLANIPNL